MKVFSYSLTGYVHTILKQQLYSLIFDAEHKKRFRNEVS